MHNAYHDTNRDRNKDPTIEALLFFGLLLINSLDLFDLALFLSNLAHFFNGSAQGAVGALKLSTLYRYCAIITQGRFAN